MSDDRAIQTPMDALAERAGRVTSSELNEFTRACFEDTRRLPTEYLRALELECFSRHSGGALLYAAREMFLERATNFHFRTNLRDLITHNGSFSSEDLVLALVSLALELPRNQSFAASHLIGFVTPDPAFVIETLEEHLVASTSPHRRHVYEALQEVGEQGKEAFWLKALSNSLKRVRSAAIAALRTGDVDSVRAAIAARVGEGNKGLRGSHIEALEALGVDASCESSLHEALASEKDPDLALAISRLLAPFDDAPEPGQNSDDAAGGASSSETPDEGASPLEEAREVLAAMRAARRPGFLARTELSLAWSDGTSLDGEEVDKVISRLKKEGPKQEPDALTRQICGALQTESLAEFGRAIEARWLATGAKAGQKWSVYQLALTATDEDIERIAPTLEALSSEGSYRRAQWYLDVFERIDSQTARDWIFDICAYGPADGAIQRHAEAQIDRLVSAENTTRAEFYETLDMYRRERSREARMASPDMIPDETSFSLGERSLVLSMNPEFELLLHDPDTRQTYTQWPELAPEDDPEAFEEASARFARLAEQVHEFVRDWRRHLETAMISGRPFTMAYLRDCFLTHPVLARLLETLVFVLDDGSSVRFSQGQLLDPDYDERELEDDAILALAHPLEVSETLRTRWGAHLAESELIQLFPQFGREIYMRPHELVESPVSLDGKSFTSYTMQRALASLGWRHGPVGSGGYYGSSEHTLPGRGVRMFLTHGIIHVQAPEQGMSTSQMKARFQTLTADPLPISQLSDVVYSEACLLHQRVRNALLDPDPSQ